MRQEIPVSHPTPSNGGLDDVSQGLTSGLRETNRDGQNKRWSSDWSARPTPGSAFLVKPGILLDSRVSTTG